MTHVVQQLLRARYAAYRAGNTNAYSAARTALRRGINSAKVSHRRWIEAKFHDSSNPQQLWEGINAVTDYSRKITSPSPDYCPTLAEGLNIFYAQFDVLGAAGQQSHQGSNTPLILDPYQFAYRENRSTEDTIATVLHALLEHLEWRNTYTRLLFIDFSSAHLGLNTTLCNWVLDFLTNRSEYVRVSKHSSSTLLINTGAPQGCVLGPLLYTLFTHDCCVTLPTNLIVKFAYDTTVLGLINNNECAYKSEVQNLAAGFENHNLALNIKNTKEMIVDF